MRHIVFGFVLLVVCASAVWAGDDAMIQSKIGRAHV